MSTPHAADGASGRGPAVPDAALVAHVEPYDGAPDECTIYPAGLDEADLLTSWISAQEGSFVERAAMR